MADEFQKEPRTLVLLDQMAVAGRQGESKDQPLPPEVLAAREKLGKLKGEYKELLHKRTSEIRKRLAAEDQGPLSEARIRELEVAVEKARRTKEALAQQIGKTEIQWARDTDRVETEYLNREIENVMNLQDQVVKNLEQLKFESKQDNYRVVLVDPASVPKTPSNNKRLEYMAGVPIVAFLAVLGLFVVREWS